MGLRLYCWKGREPIFDRVKRVPIGQIKRQQDPPRIPVMTFGYTPESLLAGRVPSLKNLFKSVFNKYSKNISTKFEVSL